MHSNFTQLENEKGSLQSNGEIDNSISKESYMQRLSEQQNSFRLGGRATA